MCWRLRLSDKTVCKFAELPIYCQRQKCSPGNVVSGSVKFMQIFAGVRWRGGVKWDWGSWKWRLSLHSFTVFRTFYIHGHTTTFRWYDCQLPWAYMSNVLKTVTEWTENINRHFLRPHSHLTPPLQRTPANICINLTLPGTTFLGLHFLSLTVYG